MESRSQILSDIRRKIDTYGYATVAGQTLRKAVGPHLSLHEAATQLVADTPWRAEISEVDGIEDRARIVPKETS